MTALCQQGGALSCSATSKGGVHHSLTIEEDESEMVNGFSYQSLSQDGATCEIIAQRKSKKSKWLDGEGGLVVTTYALGQEAGSVRIEKPGSTIYKITVLSEMYLSCGLQGYLAPVVELSRENGKCQLRKG